LNHHSEFITESKRAITEREGRNRERQRKRERRKESAEVESTHTGPGVMHNAQARDPSLAD